jgi:hypothetical protein
LNTTALSMRGIRRPAAGRPARPAWRRSTAREPGQRLFDRKQRAVTHGLAEKVSEAPGLHVLDIALQDLPARERLLAAVAQ